MGELCPFVLLLCVLCVRLYHALDLMLLLDFFQARLLSASACPSKCGMHVFMYVPREVSVAE